MTRYTALLLAIFSIGCSTPKKNTAPAPLQVTSVSMEKPWRSARTYAFHPRAVQFNRDVHLHGVHGMLHSAIETELSKRNIKRVPADEADILIGYIAGLDHSFTQASVDRVFDFELDKTSASKTHAPGTVAIVMVNRQVNRLVWRGAIQTNVILDLPLSERHARVNSAVKQLFRHAD